MRKTIKKKKTCIFYLERCARWKRRTGGNKTNIKYIKYKYHKPCCEHVILLLYRT